MVAETSLDPPAVDVAPCPRPQLVVVRDQRAALAGGHQFADLEREGAEASEAPHAPSAPARAVGVGTVLDQDDPAPIAQLDERVQVARRPRDMHGDDRPGALGHRVLGCCRIDAERAGVDVNQHRRRVDGESGGGARDEGQGRHDHLVALAHAACGEGGLERVASVRDPESVTGALQRGELRRPEPRLPSPRALDQAPDSSTSPAAPARSPSSHCGHVGQALAGPHRRAGRRGWRAGRSPSSSPPPRDAHAGDHGPHSGTDACRAPRRGRGGPAKMGP